MDKATNPTPDARDELPMTIGHGRKLFGQNKKILDTLDVLAGQLQPLLQPDSPSGEEDPIRVMIAILETIQATQERQGRKIQEIDRKLSEVISGFTAGSR